MAQSNSALIYRLVNRYIVARRISAAVICMAWALSVGIAWVLFCCAIDRWIVLPPLMRLSSLILSGAAVIVLIMRLAWLMLRKFDSVTAAIDIEARQPIFDQRLITVVSHPSSPNDSPMLGRLSDEVCAIIHQRKTRGLISLRPFVVPSLALVALLVLSLTLNRSTRFNLPLLVRRFCWPMAGIAPVTTTQIQVKPGNTSVLEGLPVTILANISPVPESPILLHLCDDGHTWTDWPMNAGAQKPGGFSIALPSIDRDVSYFVTGGDAVSPTFQLSLLRAPVLVEVRIRIQPPALLRRPASTVVNNDASFSAPVGSRIVMDAVSTQPLKSAVLVLGREELEMLATADPAIRRVTFTVRRDLRDELRFTATNGLTYISPRMGTVHAIALPQAGASSEATPRSEMPGYDDQLKLYFQGMDQPATTSPAK